MRAKPNMKPWVYTNESNIELRRSGTITRAFVLRLGSAAPLGLNKCIPIINPGLAPLGYAGVSPLQGSSSSSLPLYYFDAIALGKGDR